MSLEDYPSIELPLPDGTRLKAVAIDDENFPAIFIGIGIRTIRKKKYVLQNLILSETLNTGFA